MPPPEQAIDHDPEQEQGVSQEIAAPFVRLIHQDERPFHAHAPDPAWSPPQSAAQMVEQPSHSNAKIAPEAMGIPVNPYFLDGIAEPDQQNSSAGAIDFIHNNPIFEFHPVSYTNDPFRVAQNDRMIAINSALQVDLTGQVVSDSIGTCFYSGFGGQVDFIRGAARSKGGKPIIALPATAKDDSISRIVPMPDPGSGVVTSRADVHYVVTEYGVAYLHGKNIRQRAEALINIAHPKFRNELFEYAGKQRWLRAAEKLV